VTSLASVPLRCLVLNGTGVSCHDVSEGCVNPRLECLSLQDARVTRRSLQILLRMSPNIKHLNLGQATKKSDLEQVLGMISGLPLESLVLTPFTINTLDNAQPWSMLARAFGATLASLYLNPMSVLGGERRRTAIHCVCTTSIYGSRNCACLASAMWQAGLGARFRRLETLVVEDAFADLRQVMEDFVECAPEARVITSMVGQASSFDPFPMFAGWASLRG